MNIELRKLRYLATLARHRSFSRAAIELGLTQPALSRSIADLEAEFGERLFDRTREGVVPTVFGIPVIDQAEQLLAEADRFVSSLQARTSADFGVLAFGAGPLIAALYYPDLLSAMARNHPGLVVKAGIAPGKTLAEALRAQKIEFAVFAEPLLVDRGALSAEVIGSVEIGYLVRRGHPLAAGRPVSFAQIKAFPIASGGERGLDGQSHVLHETDFPPTIQCDDFTILQHVTRSSDAIWMTAISFARSQTELDLLDVPDGPMRHIPLVLVTAAGRSLSPAAREAVQLLRAAILERHAPR